MNARQRTMEVLAGRIPDRVPVCLHNFLPAARESGISMAQYRCDPEAVARAHYQAWEKYQHDCILVDLDTTMLAEAMGAPSDVSGDEPGHIAGPAITSLDAVDSLSVVVPEKDGRIPVLLESIRLLRRKFGDTVAIRGNCDQGPFSLACLLRGNQDFLVDLLEAGDTPELRQLLDVCYESHLAVHRAVMAAGADFTSLGDSFGGPDVISPAMFDVFARPYLQRLVETLTAEEVYTVIHICGNTNAIFNSLQTLPECGFEIDYKTDADRAKQTIGRNHVLFGNVDPSGAIARGTTDAVRRAAAELIAQWKPGGRFILNAGCAIPAGTSPENLHALIQAAIDFGRYGMD